MNVNYWLVLPLFFSFVLYSIWIYVRDVLLENRSTFDKIISEAFVGVLCAIIWIVFFAVKYFFLR